MAGLLLGMLVVTASPASATTGVGSGPAAGSRTTSSSWARLAPSAASLPRGAGELALQPGVAGSMGGSIVGRTGAVAPGRSWPDASGPPPTPSLATERGVVPISLSTERVVATSEASIPVHGYLLLVGSGGVSNFAAPWDGSLNGKLPTGVRAVGIAFDGTNSSSTGGYWILTSNGGVTNFDAPWFGSPKAAGGAYADTGANPVAAITVGAGGVGYDVLRANGGVDNYDTSFHGSLANELPTGVHAVAIAADPTTGGYWILTSNGGVTNFDAPWFGSPKAAGGAYADTGANPVVAITAGAGGVGYDVLRANGGVDNYGTAWHGSLANRLPSGVHPSGIATDPVTGGYWITTSAGNVFNEDAPFWGSLAGTRLPAPVDAIAPESGLVAPSAVATSLLPSATVSLGYSARLVVSGGVAPYTWSLAAGSAALPAGLSLAPDGVISGTPTASASSARVTVVVRDPADTATASLTLLVYQRSGNWSGWAVGNPTSGSFTGAKGTFTVPSLQASPTGSAVSEWVGVDGITNSDLIQAGVLEQPVPGDPSRFTIEPWWEILPAPLTPITSVTVRPGDTVTVQIAETAPGSGRWTISLEDMTTGKSLSIQKSYTGPGTSAEWIVEAPTVCANASPSSCAVAPLAHYTPTTFSGLATAGGQPTASAGFALVQNGVQVSTPSPLATAGFRVTYGATMPLAP